MKAEIVTVEQSKERDRIRLTVIVQRPAWPKNYENTDESTAYLKAVAEWQSLHTGGIGFEYDKFQLISQNE